VNVYLVENGVLKSTTVRDVKDDGTHAIVTGLTAGQTIVSDVNSVDVGNGDASVRAAEPLPPRRVGCRHKHNKCG